MRGKGIVKREWEKIRGDLGILAEDIGILMVNVVQ